MRANTKFSFGIDVFRSVLLWNLWAICALLVTCSLEEAPVREIRAHSLGYDGVLHAGPARKAERYCQKCHGVGLAGGENLEPSCYQCHGKNWEDSDPDLNSTPADHTEQYEKWFHHSELKTPVGSCDSCHGVDLEGNTTSDRPSCFLCHEQKW